MKKINWFKRIIIFLALSILISYIIYGSIIPPKIKEAAVGIRGKTTNIDWKYFDGTQCWEFDKKTNLLSLEIIVDCNRKCNAEYHLVSKDYFCNTETGIVTCICKSP